MDTYRDYQNYKQDNIELIKTIKKNCVSTYIFIEDIIDVLDYVAKEKAKNTKLEEELLNLFDFGYDFLSAFLSEMDFIYRDYLNSQDLLLIKYDKVISYWFYLQDLKSFVEYDLNKDASKLVKLLDEVDLIIKEQKAVSEDLYNYYEEQIASFDPKAKHKPIFAIYALVKEELMI